MEQGHIIILITTTTTTITTNDSTSTTTTTTNNDNDDNDRTGRRLKGMTLHEPGFGNSSAQLLRGLVVSANLRNIC